MARTSVYWRRARGSTNLIGEVIGLITAVMAGAMLIRVGFSTEEAYSVATEANTGDISVVQHHCQEQIEWYRFYYSAGLFCIMPLILFGGYVPVALCYERGFNNNNRVDADMWRTLRRITDELGYNLAQQMEEFQPCHCLKWLIKLTLISILGVAYGEVGHDVYIRDPTCRSQALADELACWFGWALFVRCLSTGWDFFFDLVAFRILSRFQDIEDHEIAPDKTEFSRRESVHMRRHRDPRQGQWQPLK